MTIPNFIDVIFQLCINQFITYEFRGGGGYQKIWFDKARAWFSNFWFKIIYIHLILMGENMIKYTFHDPCQEKCKVAINQALTYQN
jgi:hypothetical protein